MTATVSPNRAKKNAKKAAALVAAEQARLFKRIRNLFELEGWSTARIAEAVELPRGEVIRLIQSSTPKQTEGLL
jgi:hypothetical protein